MSTNPGSNLRSGTTPLVLGNSARGTYKDFYFEHFGATFEGRRNKENTLFEEHTSMWIGIISGLLLSP